MERSKVPGRRNQREQSDQRNLISWFKLQYPKELLFAIPNQLVRSDCQAFMMGKEGLVSGIPDLMLACPKKGYCGMFLELKRLAKPGEPRGKLTKRQEIILEHLSSRRYLAVVCYGFDECREAVLNYMRD